MDPNAALKGLRDLIWEFNHDDNVTMETFDTQALIDYVEALDQWLARGGFLPDSWGVKAKTIEVLHGRDPDYECGITVYVNGIETQCDVEDIDPGRGWTRSQWSQRIAEAHRPDSRTPAFHDSVLRHLEQFASNRYITED